MNKLKKKSKGRPKYVPDTRILRQLYIKVRNKELTNAEAWEIAGCKHSLWFELKKKYENLEVNKNVKSN